MKNIYLLISALIITILVGCHDNKTNTTFLQVEMQQNPEGLTTLQPRFTWQITSIEPNTIQKSYKIQVASNLTDLKKEKNLLWDSGIINSDQSHLIPYDGEQLASRGKYYWRVKVATNQNEGEWSTMNYWSMGLLNESDWEAEWIGENSMSNPSETAEGDTRLSARYLRKPFESKGKIKRAMIYISGLGTYEAYINGQRISKDVLSPTPSWYPEKVYYNVYDVTSLIQNKENLLSVVLGNGRFFGMRGIKTMMFGLPRLLAQLEIEYLDGNTDIITSDKTWIITSKGPIVANNEYDGEEYDARLELTGFQKLDFDDSSWGFADIMDAPHGSLVAQPNPNLQVQEEIRPVKITKLADSKFLLDMGQNMVGWLNVNNLKGQKNKPVTFRFAELINPDSTLYLANLRSAKASTIYTPAQDGNFTWEPSLTYYGFRFVEISGLDYEPNLNNFKGKVVYDKMETTGQFVTSNEIINKVYQNAYWGIRGNYRGMPTDCPQRDERQGWLGDRTTGCFGEAFIFNNAALYSKWIQDIEDSQSPEGSISDVSPRYKTRYNDDVTWPAAYFYSIDMLHKHFGDIRPIKEHYVSMKKYLDYIQAISMQDFILTKDTYGDWCMPPEKQELIHSEDPNRKTAKAVLSTTMYYSLLNLMMEFAEITDHKEDIVEFEKLAIQIKKAYNDLYFNTETARYDNNTVTANMLSLQLGLVPNGYEERVFDNIVEKTEVEFNGHVSVGVLGIQHLMRGLTKNGNLNLAYKIATNETYPSWGYMINKGATTIWELWNGDTADPAMNSANHVMLLGDLIIWYYEDLAGIKNAPASVAFKRLFMEPKFPEGLSYVNASYRSIYGKIKSEWKKENGVFSWNISIPANTSAIVKLPKEINIVTPIHAGVRRINTTKTANEIELGSGSYTLIGKY